MTALKTAQYSWISPPVLKAVQTRADDESPVTTDKSGLQDAWDAIESQLIRWGSNPSELENEGLQRPTGESLSLAIKVAAALSQAGVPAPSAVVPDAHGAIVFELRNGGILQSVHFHPNNSIEYRQFRGHRLLRRESVQLEQM